MRNSLYTSGVKKLAAAVLLLASSAQALTHGSEVQFDWSVSQQGTFVGTVNHDCEVAAQSESDRVVKILLAHNYSADAVQVDWSVRLQTACTQTDQCPTMPRICSLAFFTNEVAITLTDDLTNVYYGADRWSHCDADRNNLLANPDTFLTMDEDYGWFFKPGCRIEYGQILF